jgi:hypothetical protein
LVGENEITTGGVDSPVASGEGSRGLSTGAIFGIVVMVIVVVGVGLGFFLWYTQRGKGSKAALKSMVI